MGALYGLRNFTPITHETKRCVEKRGEMELNPKKYGLSTRSCLERIDDTTLALVILRKSRIIMADGKKIREKAACIAKVDPALRVVLKTNAPVCSKTQVFLRESGVEIVYVDE